MLTFRINYQQLQVVTTTTEHWPTFKLTYFHFDLLSNWQITLTYFQIDRSHWPTFKLTDDRIVPPAACVHQLPAVVVFLQFDTWVSPRVSACPSIIIFTDISAVHPSPLLSIWTITMPSNTYPNMGPPSPCVQGFCQLFKFLSSFWHCQTVAFFTIASKVIGRGGQDYIFLCW